MLVRGGAYYQFALQIILTDVETDEDARVSDGDDVEWSWYCSGTFCPDGRIYLLELFLLTDKSLGLRCMWKGCRVRTEAYTAGGVEDGP